MQHWETIRKVVGAASTVRELTVETRTYRFNVPEQFTFYLDAGSAEVTVARWPERWVEVRARLQVGLGWRLQTDQDEAGVYVVAKRRAVVGGIARASFSVNIPHDTHVILKLEDGQLKLDHLNGTLHVPPFAQTGDALLQLE
jgi:hypothetical protein